MKSYNSFSDFDSFSELDSTSGAKLIVFKPQNATSQVVAAEKLRQKSSRISRVSQFWQSFVRFLSGSSEPRISQKRDRSGNLYFQVHDPVSGQSLSLYSEQEVRMWIDQRYSR
jgi:hypothetical protein